MRDNIAIALITAILQTIATKKFREQVREALEAGLDARDKRADAPVTPSREWQTRSRA